MSCCDYASCGVCDTCRLIAATTRAQRPTLSPMTTSRKKSRSCSTFTFIVLAIAAAVLIMFAAESDAHVVRYDTCKAQWAKAPVGSKWQAQQRCEAMVYRHNCITHRLFVPATVRVKGQVVDRGQRRVIGWLVHEALRRELPRIVLHAALATGTQESSLRELDHGHGTSVGPFQLIDLHGSQAQRQSIGFSGTWFYNGAIRSYRRNPSQSIVALAHSVQRSRHPEAVAQWIPEAAHTISVTIPYYCKPNRR